MFFVLSLHWILWSTVRTCDYWSPKLWPRIFERVSTPVYQKSSEGGMRNSEGGRGGGGEGHILRVNFSHLAINFLSAITRRKETTPADIGGPCRWYRETIIMINQGSRPFRDIDDKSRQRSTNATHDYASANPQPWFQPRLIIRTFGRVNQPRA